MNSAVDTVAQTKTAISTFITFLLALLAIIDPPILGLEDTAWAEVLTAAGVAITTIFFRQGVLKVEKKLDAATTDVVVE